MTAQPYPPLPEPLRMGGSFVYGTQFPLYTSDQMRAYAAAALAKQSARHAEELAAYELTVSSLRSQALADIAAEAQDAGEYTAPQAQPERKPMTDGEKLYAMWHSSDANDLDDFLDGWRHAEAFHGIKEKP